MAVPAMTHVATDHVVELQRATPVFIDVDPATGNMDPDALEAAAKTGLKAVMPVHYLGLPCDMDRINAIAKSAGALVVAPILEALGVLHAEPRLVVMPRDSARLGQFAAEFGGMLGTIEERPEESDEGTGFGGAADIISTEKLLEELRESPNDRVDARAYLAARLTDIYLGDWDRHADQWRWARFGAEVARCSSAVPPM